MTPARPVRAVVIGAAVLALAGCTDDQQPDGTPAATPSAAGTPSPATLQVKLSTFQVAYRLDGTTAAGAAVGLDIPPGTVLTPSKTTGRRVAAGDRLGTLRAADTTAGTNGTVARSQQRLAADRVGPLTAPVAGIARLSPGAARVEAPGLDVVVPLKPLQQLRYRALRFEGTATVETVLGQRQSRCLAIWLEDLPATGEAEQAATTAVHCRLAPDVETAAGLPAVLTLTSPREDDVLAVPLVYLGLDKTGQDYVARVQDGSRTVERPVVVGSTDGVRRLVLDGLSAGDLLTPIDAP